MLPFFADIRAMDMHFLRRLALPLAFSALLCAACSKKPTPETPYLTGLSIETPLPYYALGDSVRLTAIKTGLGTSDGASAGTLGMYWYVHTNQQCTTSTNLAARDADLKSPWYKLDTVGTVTVHCCVFSTSEHTNAYKTATLTVIDPTTAMEGLRGERQSIAEFPVPLRTVTIDSMTWLAENLYGETEADTSRRFYGNAPVTASLLGKYCTFSEAQNACPAGWHLPDTTECSRLLGEGQQAGALMAGAVFNGSTLWGYGEAVEITNETGFNAIPAGYYDLHRNMSTPMGYGSIAAFWTQDKANEDGDTTTPPSRWFCYLHKDSPALRFATGSEGTLALSVRCVKD